MLAPFSPLLSNAAILNEKIDPALGDRIDQIAVIGVAVAALLLGLDDIAMRSAREKFQPVGGDLLGGMRIEKEMECGGSGRAVLKKPLQVIEVAGCDRDGLFCPAM